MATKSLAVLFCVGFFGLAHAVNYRAPPCDTVSDCPQYAACSLKYCQCSTNYVLSGDWTKCLQVIPVPYDGTLRCEESSQCTPRMREGAICSEGMCVCKEGYHYLHGVCHLSSGLGKQCKADDCSDGYSFEAYTCGSNNTCECAVGFYLVKQGYQTCRKEGTKVNDECIFDMDCKGTDLYCNTTIDQCVDDPATQKVTSSGKVSWPTTNSKVGNRCTYSTDCSGNTMDCFLNECVCKQGYSNFSNYCMPDIGEKCTSHDDCAHITNAECGTDSRCRCKLPYVKTYNNRQCRITRLYGTQCQADESCMPMGGYATCNEENKCSCKQGYHYVESIELCVDDKAIGQKCYNDHDCTAANATCQNLYCDCIAGFHRNVETSNTCVPDVAYFGDYCLTTSDCLRDIGNSECVNNTCICATGYFEDSCGYKCNTGVKGKCSVDEDCMASMSFCQGNICICPNETRASSASDKCLAVGEHGSVCEEDLQCTEQLGTGGGCLDGQCGCKEGYHHRANFCWDSRNLGDPCEMHNQCYLKSGLLSRVNCENGFCSCGYEYQQTSDLECRSGVGRYSSSAAVTGLLLLITVLNMRDGWTAGRP